MHFLQNLTKSLQKCVFFENNLILPQFSLTILFVFAIMLFEEGVVGAKERGWIDILGQPRFSLK